jgi:hypothetical protein
VIPDPTAVLAADRQRELRAAAAHRRLVALLRCCRPAAWRRTLTRLHTGLRRATLAPLDTYCSCA